LQIEANLKNLRLRFKPDSHLKLDEKIFLPFSEKLSLTNFFNRCKYYLLIVLSFFEADPSEDIIDTNLEDLDPPLFTPSTFDFEENFDQIFMFDEGLAPSELDTMQWANEIVEEDRFDFPNVFRYSLYKQLFDNFDFGMFPKMFRRLVATEDVNDWVSPLEAEEITYLGFTEDIDFEDDETSDITWTFGFAEVIYHQFTLFELTEEEYHRFEKKKKKFPRKNKKREDAIVFESLFEANPTTFSILTEANLHKETTPPLIVKNKKKFHFVYKRSTRKYYNESKDFRLFFFKLKKMLINT